MAAAALAISILSALSASASAFIAWWVHQQQGAIIVCKWQNRGEIRENQLSSFVSVEATNRGRSPTTITGWGVEWRNRKGRRGKRGAVQLEVSGPPIFPYRLESETSHIWGMPWTSVAESQPIKTGGSVDIPFAIGIPFVRTGANRIVYAPTPIDLDLMREQIDPTD
jgi:hypothetical protein